MISYSSPRTAESKKTRLGSYDEAGATNTTNIYDAEQDYITKYNRIPSSLELIDYISILQNDEIRKMRLHDAYGRHYEDVRQIRAQQSKLPISEYMNRSYGRTRTAMKYAPTLIPFVRFDEDKEAV